MHPGLVGPRQYPMATHGYPALLRILPCLFMPFAYKTGSYIVALKTAMESGHIHILMLAFAMRECS